MTGVENCNIAVLLQAQAEVRPHAAAILDRHRAFSFADLELAASSAATQLQQAGLRSGDAALVFQPMSIELYVALMALFRLGMIAMFLDPSAGREHIDRCCRLYPPQALIASSKAHLLRFRSPALQQIRVKFAIGFPIPGAKRWVVPKGIYSPAIASCLPETPALLTFTSGSTGQPKAALRTHGFLLAQHQVLSESLKLTPGTIDLTTLPIFALANLASGVTSLIPDADLRFPGRIHPARVMAQIQAHRPLSTAASPAFLERLADHCEQQHLSLSSFVRIFGGGAPVLPRLQERLQRLAPKAEVTAVYGSTEAEPIAHISQTQVQPQDKLAMSQGAGLLVGRPVSAIQLRILPQQWGQAIGFTASEFATAALPVGTAGEIVVSGNHVLPGYLHGQGNQETKFRVGDKFWHRTGDMGYLDEQGRLWLLGRCPARIEDQDGILYPFAVEVAASYHAGIRRSAVVSHQGQRWLAIELTPPIARDSQARQSCLNSLKSSLAWAELRVCKIYRQLPVDKRHNAKIDYPALHKLISTRR